eukprot:960634-Rhodomonas_salina.5
MSSTDSSTAYGPMRRPALTRRTAVVQRTGSPFTDDRRLEVGCYYQPMRCSVLGYAKAGTDLAYGATREMMPHPLITWLFKHVICALIREYSSPTP